MSDKYILDGHKAVVEDDLMVWGKWFEDADRHVAVTHLPAWPLMVLVGKLFKTKRFDPAKVSTVFLGLDHSFGDGELQLFETMIFGGKQDEEMRRYATWEEAEAGHKEMVKIAS